MVTRPVTIPEKVRRWHLGDGQGQELHEYLGMTWDEWTTYAQGRADMPTRHDRVWKWIDLSPEEIVQEIQKLPDRHTGKPLAGIQVVHSAKSTRGRLKTRHEAGLETEEYFQEQMSRWDEVVRLTEQQA